MSVELAFPDSIVGCADALPPPFGGLDAAWVHVAGELDIATTPQLERTLHESQAQARLVVLDLRELAFIDSSGVHAVVNASIRARQAGRLLIVLRGTPNVDRIFTLTACSNDVEIGDVDPVAPSAHALQRSLVASSLLETDEKARNHEPAR
jgi:anti-sigma B factor antagonist